MPQEYANICYGKSEPKDSKKRLTNGSGSFFIDSDGVLMDFDCHLENGGRQELFRLNIPELRVPAECWEYLKGNMRDWYWPKMEINELTEPKLGPMCCFKVTNGIIEGEGIVPKVMCALGCGEE